MEASAVHLGHAAPRAATAHGVLLRLRSDEQLLTLFRSGNEDAFQVLHDRYRPRLLAYVRRMLPPGARSDAEDALQDVFVRAYGALRADDRPVAVRAWLYRVAHNRCIDALRRPAPLPVERSEREPDAGRGPSDQAELREELAQLVSDLQRLPEAQRSCLLLREIEGLSYAELGVVLQTSQPAVKSLLVRARMGLADAAEARALDCTTIRADLAAACERGVRISSRARLHVRDCDACAGYQRILRETQKQVAGLAPGAGPLATLLKLVGLGGGGAAAGTGTIGGGAAGGTTIAGLAGGGSIATKVAVVVCCVAVTTGGAVEAVRIPRAAAPQAAPEQAAPAATQPAPGAAALRTAPATTRRAPVAERDARPERPVTPTAAAPPATAPATADTPTDAEDATGGVAAPAEDPETPNVAEAGDAAAPTVVLESTASDSSSDLSTGPPTATPTQSTAGAPEAPAAAAPAIGS